MKLTIDTESRTLTVETGGVTQDHPLYSDEAFDLISDQWVKVGWNQRYSYAFSWFGRPIIQLPEDIIRIQEVIYRVQPDVIIETGVAHGGSLIFYASLFQAIGKGRVIGVDIEIRPKNRLAIESHPLGHRIELIEGSSTAPTTLQKIGQRLKTQETILIILDSDHSRAHVAEELMLYSPWVTPGSYIVATDGIMKDLADVPRGNPAWVKDNPTQAAIEFAAAHPEFVLEQPSWPFNESSLRNNITHWPSAYLRKL